MKQKDLIFRKITMLIFAVLLAFGLSISANGTTAYAASSIQLSKKSISLYVGNSSTIKLYGAPASQVKWSSSSSSATVKNGKITAMKKGTAYISAKYKGKSYKCKVTVKSSKLSEKSLTLRIGQGYGLEVLKTTGKVKWSSNNSSIAKVNSNGYISPKKVGTTKIKAQVGSELYVCTLRVVRKFTEEDFVFDTPSDEGYTNFIDYHTAKPTWYWYWDDTSEETTENRKINVGSTFAEFTKAYGYVETVNVYSNDNYSKHFNNSSYPRVKAELVYKDERTQTYYYKNFYFDRHGTVVLIIMHC